MEGLPLNIVILGEMGVGKSALMMRFACKKYKPQLPSTVIDVHPAHINVENKKVDLILWDTAGQERFRAVVSQYFRKADGVLLVYDVTNINSFSKLPKWLSKLKEINETAPIIIVGNKIDEINHKNVCVNAVKEFADKHKLEFIEASAKTGENVDQVFEKLATEILKSTPVHSLPTNSVLEIQNESPESEVISVGIGHYSTKARQTNRRRKRQLYGETQTYTKSKCC
ncbi:ras-related protein Rab-18A [Trichonephila inaurata madagascariensis]|uniref:Ras-related protein Rab-18A n=1 Tax=Trichonephila inaurata madagascariensis TaxID=2747483 RepID=A0A8X6YCT6_9ARAC|nr:ras-related protein Rab-18A [Trichonephila inaurata madagascariensis]